MNGSAFGAGGPALATATSVRRGKAVMQLIRSAIRLIPTMVEAGSMGKTLPFYGGPLPARWN
ncbi:hypothetical protein CKO39_15070 [Rhodopseudomonas palustris]|nr:hypothetical protein B1S06_07525 [Rhodopseudomonas palustris]PPQ42860.1 hypothetical protein CKO39_15070 [Rhodopseudomonas palustris]